MSNTVFGLDTQLPIPFISLGGAAKPMLFGELALSRFSADYRNVPAIGDAAVVVGLRLKLPQATATLQFQNVGANFVSGVPFQYFGNAPPAFQNFRGVYLPEWFGFASTAAINATRCELNARAARGGTSRRRPRRSTRLTAYPVWNRSRRGPGGSARTRPTAGSRSTSPRRCGWATGASAAVGRSHLQERQTPTPTRPSVAVRHDGARDATR